MNKVARRLRNTGLKIACGIKGKLGIYFEKDVQQMLKGIKGSIEHTKVAIEGVPVAVMPDVRRLATMLTVSDSSMEITPEIAKMVMGDWLAAEIGANALYEVKTRKGETEEGNEYAEHLLTVYVLTPKK